MASYIDKAHFNMLEQQVRPSDVLNPRVLQALNNIVRADFVDEELAGLAYADTELPIGFGQVMLSPVLQGRLLQALDIHADEMVLEIGTGTGYFTALLAQLAKQVISVEIMPDLSVLAQQNLEDTGIENVTLCVGDASQGWTLSERVDIIVVTAAFISIPDDYLQNVSVGGRILAIVGEGDMMEVTLIQRTDEQKWHTKIVFETVAPAMINSEVEAKFEF